MELVWGVGYGDAPETGQYVRHVKVEMLPGKKNPLFPWQRSSIAATKAVEQPSVQVLLTERLLNWTGDRSFHGSRGATLLP